MAASVAKRGPILPIVLNSPKKQTEPSIPRNFPKEDWGAEQLSLGATQSFLHLSSELRILSLLGSHLSLRCYPAYVRQQWTLPLVKGVCELAKVVLVKTGDADGEWAGSNIFEAWQLCYSLVGRCVILPSRTHQRRRSISFLLFHLSLFSLLFLSNSTH